MITTPPKTASDTLHRVFCSGSPWNGLAVVGEHSQPRNIDKHYPCVPNEARSFRKLLCVRHPLDRLVSLWHHRCRLHAWEGQATESFNRFCELLVGGELKTWLWRTTIAELVPWEPDGLLRCESLAMDLDREGLNVREVPRHNTSFRRPWQEYYTPTLLDLIRPWATADCERFGYELPI